MRWKAALGATGVLVLCAAGCTDSDVLSTGNSDVILQIEVVNAQTRFNFFAEFSISQLNLRPNDPASDASLGAAAVAIIQETSQVIKVTLNNLPSIEPKTLLLSSGSWRLNSLQVSNPFFIDSTAEPPPVTCDKQQFYSFNGIISYSAADLGPAANFNVAPGAPPIRVQIDGANFVEAFQDSFCTPTGALRPSFDAAAMAYFKSQAQTYIRVVQ